jgi:DNA-binding CsgD family transcriptional regulator
MKIDRAEVARLLKQGMNGVQIAKRLKCAPNSISVIRKELGYQTEARKPTSEWKKPLQRRVRNRAPMVEHEALKPYLARDCTLTNDEIAEATGLSIRIVWAARMNAIGKRYSTERDHLARIIGEWPAGIHFEDSRDAARREPVFRGTPPAFGISLIGNGSAMSADKLGFI